MEGQMRKGDDVFLLLVLIAVSATQLGAQESSVTRKGTATEREKPLVLTDAIPLENAKGRFDHFAAGAGTLFVSALGSNAVEVIDIGGRILDHTITGVPDP